MRLAVLGILCGCLLSAVRLSAAEWTQFLGPAGNSISDASRLPLHWSETENIRWKAEVPGIGWSSPVVAAGRIYLTTAVMEEGRQDGRHSLQALCLDADSGQLIWQREVFRQAEGSEAEVHQKNSHASPTPIIENDRLYVHFGPDGTACLKTDGSVIWKNQQLTYGPRHGNGGSPAVADDLLVICCDGWDVQYVAALNKFSGKLAWKTDRNTSPTKGFSFSTPTVITVSGQKQVVCPGSSAVFSYDPAEGTEIWRVSYGEGYSVVPRPMYAHGLVYVCSGFGDERVLAISPEGRGDITDTHVRWATRKSAPKSPSAILVEDLLFMVSDNGIASCLNALTGEQHWVQRLSGNYSASPLAAAGNVYFQNETGTTTIVEASPDFREVGRNQLGDGRERTFASFAVINNAIVLRSEHHLYRIEQ